jgi:hypothetical protein
MTYAEGVQTKTWTEFNENRQTIIDVLLIPASSREGNASGRELQPAWDHIHALDARASTKLGTRGEVYFTPLGEHPQLSGARFIHA